MRLHRVALTWAVLLLLLVTPTGATRCTTYAEPTLGRWQTLCADGTRAVSTWNRTLERWDTTVTPPTSSFEEKRRPPPKAPRR